MGENKHTIWVEKHRPESFEDVKGQENTISKIKAFVKNKTMPHLLFSGPAGVGKTTTSLIIAKKLFENNWNYNFLELNASDERGIDVIRTKVKDFARTKAINNVPFKIIYLDECDALTKEAQQALRRTMETYALTCRFILSCNYVSKIIEPIQSRCTIFKFQPLEKENIFELIDVISKKENLEINEEEKEALFEISNGDARKLENIMQTISSVENKFSKETIYSMANLAKPKELNELLSFAIQANFYEAKRVLLDIMLKTGLSGNDIIKQIQKEVLKLEIDKMKILKITDKCGETEFRLNEGSDQYIQLNALLAYMGYICN